MEFGIEKCAMLVMKSGKREITERTELPNQEENNKYMGILKADSI